MNYYNKITNILEEIKWPNTRVMSGATRAYRNLEKKWRNGGHSRPDYDALGVEIHYRKKQVPQSSKRQEFRNSKEYKSMAHKRAVKRMK